jgi:hypothetical protein
MSFSKQNNFNDFLESNLFSEISKNNKNLKAIKKIKIENNAISNIHNNYPLEKSEIIDSEISDPIEEVPTKKYTGPMQGGDYNNWKPKIIKLN